MSSSILSTEFHTSSYIRHDGKIECFWSFDSIGLLELVARDSFRVEFVYCRPTGTAQLINISYGMDAYTECSKTTLKAEGITSLFII